MVQRSWSPSPDTLVVGALLFARASDVLVSASEPERNLLARALIGGAVLIFLAYLLVDLAGWGPGGVSPLGLRRDRLRDGVKLGLLLALIGVTVLLPLAVQVARRVREGRHLHAHDGLVQVEEAARLLLRGENPYAASYHDTPLVAVPGIGAGSPVLEHLDYLPVLPLSAVPGVAIVEPLLGWYDHRLVYLLAFVVSLVLLARLAREGEARLTLIALAGLNPFMTSHLAFGLNDVAVLALVLIAVAALAAGRAVLGGVAVGVACAAKATAWPLAPFYALYLLGRVRRTAGGPGPKGAAQTATATRWGRAAAPAVLAWLALVLPFALWDPAALLSDTVGSVGGGWVAMGGVGFAALVLAALGPAAAGADFPFRAVQLVAATPVLFYALRRQAGDNTLRAMIVGYAVTFLVLGFFARWFYENYLGYGLVLLALAAFWDPRHEAGA